MQPLKLKKKNMLPRSGWTYTVETGLQISAGTFDKLVLDVRRHLAANKQEIPENLAEIIEHDICLRNPESMCTGDGPRRFFPTSQQIDSGTKAMIAVTIKRMAKGEQVFVSQEQAMARANECMACPLRQNLWACFVCTGLAKLVTGTYKRSTPLDRDLYACGVCGCINAAQIHLDVSVLARATKARSLSDYPDTGCWKRRELEAYHREHSDEG